MDYLTKQAKLWANKPRFGKYVGLYALVAVVLLAVLTASNSFTPLVYVLLVALTTVMLTSLIVGLPFYVVHLYDNRNKSS